MPPGSAIVFTTSIANGKGMPWTSLRPRRNPAHRRLVSTTVVPRDRSQLFHETINNLFRQNQIEQTHIVGPLVWTNERAGRDPPIGERDKTDSVIGIDHSVPV